MSMSIGGVGGPMPFDRQTFGAAVVSETLDYMNQSGSGSGMAPVDKSSAEGMLVSKTLDYMNPGSSDPSGMTQSYNFQKDVLGGYAKGVVVDAMI
ncbi:hypothetical protein [Pseudodesulfovibrio tunisiensis]|uniref:hypothetical protein n=1 Tax=Pseudodesulfovibrio tunisiensis TaxID=463192 RepID=UPI001FB30A39|nr:hypothetical protein [Pseudodesulfovibrio tunisiensis]